MEAGEHPSIPTPLLLFMSGIVWIFNNYFLMDLQSQGSLMSTIFLFVGYFVEIATAILICIRLYENRQYAVKAWKTAVKFYCFLKK